MLPVIAIVGRPNVGKSSLFNHLTKSRAALVADLPGVTRDRQFGEAMFDSRHYWIVDTGGLIETQDSAVTQLMAEQVNQAIQAADVIFFLVDGQAGLTPADQMIAKGLRNYSDKVTLVVNKVDHDDAEIALSEFYQLGFARTYAISVKRRRGIKILLNDILNEIPVVKNVPTEKVIGAKIAVVGRPNVGKSTLINRMLGEERVIVFDQPGTTRDSIYIPFKRKEKKYTLIDTAGIRRRSKVSNAIEKFSILKTLQALKESHVVILVINARDGITEQDLRLLGFAVDAGKGLVIAVNKWDGMDEYEREQVRQAMDRRMSFVNFARRYFISALHGTGVGKLYHAVDEAYASTLCEISTAELTKALEKATAVHVPPLVKGRRIRLNYAHLGGHDPLMIVVHGKQTTSLPGSYRTYLANYFRKTFKLKGIPVLIKLKTDLNPYDAKNKVKS